MNKTITTERYSPQSGTPSSSTQLKLEGVKIEFPLDLRINEADIVEWLEFRIGISSSMYTANPLSDYELSDVNISIEKCLLNDREIKL